MHLLVTFFEASVFMMQIHVIFDHRNSHLSWVLAEKAGPPPQGLFPSKLRKPLQPTTPEKNVFTWCPYRTLVLKGETNGNKTMIISGRKASACNAP